MDSVLKFLIKLQADQGNVLTVARQTTQQLDEISQKARSVGGRLREAFSFSNFKSSLMDIPGMSFLMNPYTMIAAGVGAIAKLGAQAEQTSTAFTVLVGSEQKASQVLGEISKFAAATPFSKMNLEGAAQTMLNFGVSSDAVMTRLKQLGDISMGDAQKLSSLSLVYGQVAAAGKMQGQDLQQFIDAGFNPLRELAQMTGKSYQELQEMMSKGQITVEAVEAAMKHATDTGGQFHGMMDATSKTVSGKLSTAIGELQQRAQELFPKIEPFILTAIEGFSDIAGSIMDIVGNIFSWISSLGILRTIFNGVFSLLGTLFGWLSGAVSGIITFFQNWGDVIGYVGAVIGVATIAFNAHNIAMGAYAAVTGIATAVTEGFSAAQAILNAIMSANHIGLVITLIAALIAAIVYCWNKFAGFRAVVLTVWNTLKGFGEIIKNYVIDRLRTLLSGIGKVGDALAKLFNGDYQGAWNSAVEGFKDISGASSAGKAINATKDLLGNVGTTYEQNLHEQSRKQSQSRKRSGAASNGGISAPSLKGSNEDYSGLFGAASGGGSNKGGKGSRIGTGKHGGLGGGRTTAEAMATGGTRNTSINISIAKFFDNINVTMADKTDTAELENIVVQTMNRALAIAVSTDH